VHSRESVAQTALSAVCGFSSQTDLKPQASQKRLQSHSASQKHPLPVNRFSAYHPCFSGQGVCQVKRMKAAAVALLGILASVQTVRGQQLLQLDGEEIRIQRDRYGVPHVFASSERALFYGNGYAVAQDRLWQMELILLPS
jgi:Penicillin amidase